MNEHLLAHHQHHFGQATNTPFTIAPLKDLMGYTAEGPLAQDLKNGTANIDAFEIDKYTKDMLQELQWKETDPTKTHRNSAGKTTDRVSKSGTKEQPHPH
eukprot:8616829-Ditylum_brightwellii.AAC.1